MHIHYCTKKLGTAQFVPFKRFFCSTSLASARGMNKHVNFFVTIEKIWDQNVASFDACAIF